MYGTGLYRGVEFSVRPSQISYVLPGGSYRQQDLQQVHEEAAASMDAELLPMAWEVRPHSPQPWPQEIFFKSAVITAFATQCHS